jgi:hypothetical protein
MGKLGKLLALPSLLANMEIWKTFHFFIYAITTPLLKFIKILEPELVAG